MIGVTSYPYSHFQRQYLPDFRAVAAGTITHPFLVTARRGPGSSPHDLFSGSNYDDDRTGGSEKKFRSEHYRAFNVADMRSHVVSAKTMNACGIRSEQIA